MNTIKRWWHNDLSFGVKIVLLTLLANGLPAFIILMTVPHLTEILFVWTIKPVINARLIGVMYSNAMLLVIFSAFQTKWAKVRINMVVIMLFSIFATLLTFFYLKPFLAHPWYHLAFWLTMYLILFFTAPYVFVTHERKYGGKLPVEVPLSISARLATSVFALTSLVCGLGLLFNIELVNQYWPWTLPPLVGGLIGVLFVTHAAAYSWAVWDGDWLRVKPIFWQAPLTGIMFALLPLVHPGDLRPDTGTSLTIYYLITGILILVGGLIILSYRKREKAISHA
jgi:LPXTG-motif cell wall-anchored protein